MKISSLLSRDRANYHLFVSPACPFSHRVLITLQLTQQQEHFSYTWVNDVKRENGWKIEHSDADHAGKHMRDIYTELAPHEEHRAAVPLLTDPIAKQILSTTSLEMVRFISKGLNGKNEIPITLCPSNVVREIDELNNWLQDHVNRAVYEVMSAEEQSDYEKKVQQLFLDLDVLEDRLAVKHYLIGDTLTECDILLFTTLVRFDPVYNPLFKCSMKRIADYPNLSAFLARLLNVKEIAETTHIDRIKNHYYKSLIHLGDRAISLNPSSIVPV